MPIIDLQRQVRQVGRIRIGDTVNGRPTKLSTFRLSSVQRQPIERAAELYGGQVSEMANDRSDDRWQVVTQATGLPVVIPPTHHLDQHYESWSAAGCERRCNGLEASVMDGRPTSGVPCACDPERRECRITTRLWLVLPELEALGVWRLDSRGFYAATELAGAADLCAAATARGIAIPARLDLEQRTRRSRGTDGKPQTFKYAVPVLSVDVSLPQARAILGGLDVNTGEVTQPAPVAIQSPPPRQLEQPAEPRQALPPPPAATIPAPRTHEQYEQASLEPAKPAENSKGANWHRSVAPLVPDETDRRALIWLASKGRTSSANDAKPAERTRAHDWARAINDKQAELDLSEAGGVRMVALIGPDGNDIERWEQPVEGA